MWIFTSGGLLMPATFPKDLVDKKYMDEAGLFDLQVRGRVVSHLENFIRDYMDPMGLAHSEIQKTPEMDYNARFYCAKADFAAAIAQTVLAIDYEKFKPTAEDTDAEGKPLYAEGKEYHSVLNSIWGTVCRLGSPGGKWAYPLAPLSTYKASSHTGSYKWGSGSHGRAKVAGGRTRWQDGVNDDYYSGYDYGADRHLWSQVDEDARRERERNVDSRLDEAWERAQESRESLFPDFIPEADDQRENILLTVTDLPASQWDEWLTDAEMTLVHADFQQALKEEKRQDRLANRRLRAAIQRATDKKAANKAANKATTKTVTA